MDLGREELRKARYKVSVDTPYSAAVSSMRIRRSWQRLGNPSRRWRKLISAVANRQVLLGQHLFNPLVRKRDNNYDEGCPSFTRFSPASTGICLCAMLGVYLCYVVVKRWFGNSH